MDGEPGLRNQFEREIRLRLGLLLFGWRRRNVRVGEEIDQWVA